MFAAQCALRLAMAVWSRVVKVASNWDTFTHCGRSQHIVTPAAQRTGTAPSTPPRLNPRCVQTRPTPRARPRATRASMPRCPNQRHIRARPPTHIMHRIRRHRPITSRTGAPGPKLLMTRPHRREVARMSTRTRGGPPRVSGLLDHETQIRPRAQKNEPHRGFTLAIGQGLGIVRLLGVST